MYESSKRATVATLTVDAGSVAAASTLDVTATLAGVTLLGQETPVVVVSAPSLEAGLCATAFVSAEDEITIRLCNVTAGAIDPASQDFLVAVIE